ncbi:MAG TPA: pilin [Patescibacteria group bacterium]|nr:pilin [Patescibacteria group bacterium]
MFKVLRSKLVTIVASLALAIVPVALPAVAYGATDIQNNLQCGTTFETNSSGACDTSTGTTTVNDTVKKAINFFSAIVGIVSVVMIIYGGFKYISSAGESSNVTAAKNTIIYAVIGLIIVAMAQFIVQFILGKVIS